ncbi:hypothetical protein R3P38DRAFT_2985105 [Favolaschia claudopus]|uniref:F-box domain-containing protein n=1 Tax=Favolaschia claudopus TaxID=2862362 RepID=A0AAW0AW61_9AGAR
MASRLEQKSVASAGVIWSIPPETLSEILVRCLDAKTPRKRPKYASNSQAASAVELSSHNFPLYLTEISSWWRQVALSTPALWTSVQLSLTDRSAQQNSRILGLTDFWLKRGIKGKLEIDVACFFPFPYDSSGEAASLGHLVDRYSVDLRLICLTGLPDVVLQRIHQTLAHNSFDNVEEIELEASTLEVWSTRFDALETLPCLRKVCLGTQDTIHDTVLHDLKLLFLPWHQLTHFCVSNPTAPSICLDILRQCPQLEFVKLSLIAMSFKDAPSLTLPNLCRLQLYMFPAVFDPFLDTLHLPSLYDLNLSLSSLPPWNPLHSDFWRRHAAQLRQLALQTPAMPVPFSRVFHTMSQTSSLTLKTRMTPELLGRWCREAEPLLPALTHLDLQIIYPLDISLLNCVRMILAFLTERRNPPPRSTLDWLLSKPARLERVELHDATDYHMRSCELIGMDGSLAVAMEIEFDRIRALKTGGLDLQWEIDGKDILVSRDAPVGSEMDA